MTGPAMTIETTGIGIVGRTGVGVGRTGEGRASAGLRIGSRDAVSARSRFAAGVVALAISAGLLVAMLPSMAGAPVAGGAPQPMPAPVPSRTFVPASAS
jgi:hypothetical protein